MNEVLKKPYEISLWEDTLVTENGISYYKENRIAVIGSDKMTSPNRAYNPVLTQNINGEVSFSFSIRHRYFDEEKNDIVENIFTQYLVNERKIKLKYNDEWYDFIIKECEESSEEYEFNYNAQGLFPLELGKVGYNITFDSELGNNQGTITELAKKTLESTDWIVDEEDCDILRQLLKEPVYVGTVTAVDSSANIINVDTNARINLTQGETIYLFYSQITNKVQEFVQFIRENDSDNFVEDSNGVITATNYRINNKVTYTEQNNNIIISFGNLRITVGSLYDLHQMNRMVYRQLTKYDPVLKKTVDVYNYTYNDLVDEIYHYTDYKYTTSDVVSSFISNGSNFDTYEDGIPQGWSAATLSSTKKDGLNVMPHMSVTTYPEALTPEKLVTITDFTEIESYLEVKFNQAYTNGQNTIVNTGFEDNASIIDHISAGETFVLRLRYGYSGTKHGTLIPASTTTSIAANKGLRVIVAKYTTSKKEFYNADGSKDSYYSYDIDYKKPLFDFTDAFTRSNNEITGGKFKSDYTTYYIDDVAEIPSTNYCYYAEGSNTAYIWDTKKQKYVVKPSNYLDYYMTTAKAQYSLNKKSLSDSNTHLGVFVYTKDSALVNKYIYINDIQITRYYKDSNNKVVTIGNAPEAQSIAIDQYYIKPNNNATAEEVNTYETLEALATEGTLKPQFIKPVYNKNCEKILTISESQSNCFNILQSLCETFECWLKLSVEHDERGAIKLDSEYNPIKKISFKEYIGDINLAGFKYGINLNSITRNIDSGEFVTKLIVDGAQSDVNEDGIVTIQKAKANPSKESYILDFSYYMNRGLITNKTACQHDINTFNQSIKSCNDTIFKLEDEKSKIENALVTLEAKINTISELVSEAKEEYNTAIKNFKDLTQMAYSDYVTKVKQNPKSVEDYTENGNVIEIIGTIYVTSATINNYEGILTNLRKEQKENQLKCYGAREYNISVTVEPKTTEDTNHVTEVTIDQYIDNFNFTLYNNSGFSEGFESGPNDRIFKAEDGTKIINNFIITKLPANYQIEYFVGNKKYVISILNNTYFQVHDGNPSSGVTTHKYRLVPKPEYAAKYNSISERLQKAYENKKTIEKAFYKKYGRFIQEGTWSSTDYVDHDMYYLDAVQVSHTSAQPKISYDIKVTEISGLKDFENYRFKVGDQTWVEDKDFFGFYYTIVGTKQVKTPIREHVIVSEAEWHLDEPENNSITVQNYKTQFEDLFQRITATVQTVQFNEVTYPKTSSILGVNGLIDKDLLRSSWDATATGYNLVSDGSIITDSEGIFIQDLTNSSNCVKIVNRGIKVSSDGGKTWKNVIDGHGVNADVLTAGIINTQQVWLMDGNNPSFRWDKDGISAFRHGQITTKYIPCEETEVQDDITYYNRIIQYELIDYTETDLDIINPSEEHWYEYSQDNYTLTLDTQIDESKNYYKQVITNKYEMVNPSQGDDPHENGWYKQEVTVDNTYDLKTYVRFDQYGLYGIQNDEAYVANSLEDVKDKAQFGLTWDGFFIKNAYTDGYVSISSKDDFQVVGTNVIQEFRVEDPSMQEMVVISAETSDIEICDEDDTTPQPDTTYYELDENYTFIEVTTVHEYDNPYELGWYKIVPVQTEIDLPKDNAIVVSIIKSDGTPVTNYTVENGIIIINTTKEEELTISYIIPANSIDLGGQGILQINSVEINGEPYTNYTFDNVTGVLKFDKELTIDDVIIVNYHLEHIKIGALEFDADGGAPTKYGITVKNWIGETVFETNDEGNLTVTGTINATDGVFNGTVYATDGEFSGHVEATSGEFSGNVLVGTGNRIEIDGGSGNPSIATTNYKINDQEGWCINGDGDAIFNNISVRGAIRTTVFEHDTIQAVGGAFMFRPSASIEKAEIRMEDDRADLVVTIKGANFFSLHDWIKLDDIGIGGTDMGGLTTVYEVIERTDNQIVLANGGELFIGD